MRALRVADVAVADGQFALGPRFPHVKRRGYTGGDERSNRQGRAAGPGYIFVSSTLRFWARPSSVRLSAMGLLWP